tara:strand:- start:5 stop:418 length:414 start_codon:yes stop_codon:yes gene_type:complete
MSYFANVPIITDNKGIVTDVIKADQDVIDSGLFGDSTLWWQTSYNTHGNIHYGQDGQPDGGIALRANYAGIGYTLDTTVVQDNVVGVFYAPQPYPSWSLNTQTYEWDAPVPYPNDGKVYFWDESTQSWIIASVQPIV